MIRRDFVKTSLLAGGLSGLQKALGAKSLPPSREARGYGPLVRDPQKLLDLPEGFSYQILSKRGETMSDGLLVPGQADGMAAFPGKDGRVIIVRNHELGVGHSAWGPLPNAKNCPPELPCYDPGSDSELLMPGGTTHLIFNPATKKVENQFLSLFGTDRNCAGGSTPWGSWITCEEPENLREGRGQLHGWCFEVPADATAPQEPVPLKAMGRFRHEAVAVDPETGYVYLTEDRLNGLLYRFIPKVKGELHKGGRLQALSIAESTIRDTRNWAKNVFREGAKYSIHWIDLEETDSPRDDLRVRGAQAGAAIFARCEGCWWHDGQLYFCATNGGSTRKGQLFRLQPATAKNTHPQLELFLEPRRSEVLTNGDNLTVGPHGDIIIAEDRVVKEQGHAPCCLRGVTPEGKLYTLATNRLNRSELAGVCFSPDQQFLFVNIQNPSITFAITGDWSKRQI